MRTMDQMRWSGGMPGIFVVLMAVECDLEATVR